jgi:hypothetical protein
MLHRPYETATRKPPFNPPWARSNLASKVQRRVIPFILISLRYWHERLSIIVYKWTSVYAYLRSNSKEMTI